MNKPNGKEIVGYKNTSLWAQENSLGNDHDNLLNWVLFDDIGVCDLCVLYKYMMKLSAKKTNVI